MATPSAFSKHYEIEDPAFARTLFSNTKMAWLWTLVRLWLGWDWLQAGWHKATDPAWTQGGQAIRGFWERAVAIPESGRPAIAFDWYRGFIQSLLDSNAQTWFGPLVAYGEVLIGIALILGAFTGIAAFFGAFLNWNFIMAGAASTNGMMLILTVLIILAWKIAGWYGLDRWILPMLGTPWNRRVATDEPAVVAAGR